MLYREEFLAPIWWFKCLPWAINGQHSYTITSRAYFGWYEPMTTLYEIWHKDLGSRKLLNFGLYMYQVSSLWFTNYNQTESRVRIRIPDAFEASIKIEHLLPTTGLLVTTISPEDTAQNHNKPINPTEKYRLGMCKVKKKGLL